MITIKILGPGCANCRRVEEISRKAAQDLGIDAEIVKVTDVEGILAYDIASTPGIVINEKIVSCGLVPAPLTLKNWLKDAAQAA